MRYRPLLAVTALAAMFLSQPSPAMSTPAETAARATADPQPGSPDSGDSLFPHDGNGGYDVLHYAIALRWRSDGSVTATTAVRAVATQDLSSFNLDLHGLSVGEVTVDGAAADESRTGNELTITPADPLLTGDRFTAVVSYSGAPKYVIDPDGSPDGWVRTTDGATVVAEPVGAKTWFPCNNTPADKATYAISVTVPNGKAVAANGRLVGRDNRAHATTWRWREHEPMATYLASVSIGAYDMVTGRSADGIRLRSFIDVTESGRRTARHVGAVLDHWVRRFGPYPFESGGIIVDNHRVGYSLEVQTRPIFESDPGMGTLLAHELAHQWFGDSVTPRDWSDIWLNEGFATYAEWLWQRHTADTTPRQMFYRIYRNNPPGSGFWNGVVTEPTRKTLFNSNLVYTRGALTLQAVRMAIGPANFFELVNRWTHRLAYGNATTARFETMAENVSGQSLDGLFSDWLHNSIKPPGY